MISVLLEHLLPPQDPLGPSMLCLSYLHASSGAVSAQPPAPLLPETDTTSQPPGGMAEAQHPAMQGCGLLTEYVSTGLLPGGLEVTFDLPTLTSC